MTFARTVRLHRWGAALLAVAGIFVAHAAAAQSLTGVLVVTVKDDQGAVLPGALVKVTSLALIGGPLEMTTDQEGQWRFMALPPGSYALDIGLSGFAPYREEGIYIGAGATLSRSTVLRLGGLSESIVVEGSGSRIDTRSSGIETRLGPEYLEPIPTRRFSMFDSLRSAPGVSPTSPSGGAVDRLSVFGSAGNENLFLIDGTNFTGPYVNVSRAEPSVDIIQEVQVLSVGGSAEYANPGTVFNIITRQGSDRFQYDASYYTQTSGLTSQPVLLPVAGGQSSTGYERNWYRDFTTDLGGPLIRDRLWFFTGYQYLRDSDSQPGTEPALPRRYEQNKIFAKLTWRLSPSLQLLQSFHREAWVNPQTPTLVTPFAATQRQHATVPAMTFGHLTHTPTANTLWDVRLGSFVYTRYDDPSSGDWTTPNRFDRVTGVSTGNAPQIGGLTMGRTTAKATLSHYRRGWLAADHELKLGTQIEKAYHHRPLVIPGGTRFVDSNGQPFQAISSPPSNTGGQFVSAAAFASDTVSVGDRLTIAIGVRFDRYRATSPDVHGVDAAGRETDDIIQGLGTLYTWNAVSPRVGVTTKLSGDGRTMLRASYGRFIQSVLTGELSPVHPGAVPVTTTAFDPATGGYTSLVSIVDPRVNLQVDPQTRPPSTDAWSLGVDRELRGRLAVSVAYVGKSGRDFIAWTDEGGQYREETRTLPDQRTLPVFVLTSGTASQRFVLTNPEGFSMRYHGLVTTVEKRRSNGWQAMGSYTFSRVSGLLASSGGGPSDPQLSSVVEASQPTFGRDPNNLTNADGRLNNDRPHMFRVMGTLDLPYRFSLGANLQHFSGKPWAATAQVSLPQGDQRILLEPRGSRRLPSQSMLDLRVSRTISSGSTGRVELALDVLNVLNETAEEGLATDNLFSLNFGRPTVFVDPRRAMLSVKLKLGHF